MNPRARLTYGIGMAMLLTVTATAATDTAAPTPSAKKIYQAQGKRDPFIPLVKDGKIIGGKSESAIPELMGILWDPDNPIAMMGDKELTVGDMLDDYKVVEIHETSVVLEDSEGARVEVKQKTF